MFSENARKKTAYIIDIDIIYSLYSWYIGITHNRKSTNVQAMCYQNKNLQNDIESKNFMNRSHNFIKLI